MAKNSHETIITSSYIVNFIFSLVFARLFCVGDDLYIATPFFLMYSTLLDACTQDFQLHRVR